MIKFGTGGWRAVIAEDFTFENVRKVAFALSEVIKKYDKKKKVVIGHDLRFMSGRFSRAFSEILVANGIEVLFVEEAVPTPMIMFAVEKLELDYGIMLTASHNPHEYNGVKVIVEKGKDAPVEVTKEIEDIANKTSVSSLEHEQFFDLIEKDKIKYYNNKNDYIDSLSSIIDVKAIESKNLKILFNPMFGVSKDIMLMCLASLRCYTNTINAHRDTMFGLKMPAPERASLQDMEYIMKEKKYDIGIATDGDSDRIGIYDEKGNYIDANKILKLLYYYFLNYRSEKGGIVRNITTTHTLDKIAKEYGYECYEVPVGFKYISSKMEEKDLLIGGESSGGLKIKGHVNGKDGILAALLVIEMICKTGKKISELLEEIDTKFGKMHFNMTNLEYSYDQKERIMKKIYEEKYVPNVGKKIKKTSYIDGLKIYYEDETWLSIRFSGTEPLLRITTEMYNLEEDKNIIEIIKKKIINPD